MYIFEWRPFIDFDNMVVITHLFAVVIIIVFKEGEYGKRLSLQKVIMNISLRTQLCTHACICACVYVCANACVCICVHMYLWCMRVCVWVCVWASRNGRRPDLAGGKMSIKKMNVWREEWRE